MDKKEIKRGMLNDDELESVAGGTDTDTTTKQYCCTKGCGAAFATPIERDEHSENCQYGRLMLPIIL